MHNRYGRRVKDGLIFRSSRIDSLTDGEADRFLQLGIKTIIDLRSKKEHVSNKILDRSYKMCTLKDSPKEDEVSSAPRKRYFISLISPDYRKELFMQVSCVFRVLSLLLLVVDKCFGLHLTTKLYSHLVINHQTVAEWYAAILKHANPEVASIMRLLLKDSNVPMLIHCTHGKDRTGMIIAMILGCLEVEDELIVHDYALSEVGCVCMCVLL